MTIDYSNHAAPTSPQVCLLLNGVLFVPHYTERDKYVSPGYGKHHMETYTADYLLSRGARMQEEVLLDRSWTRRV